MITAHRVQKAAGKHLSRLVLAASDLPPADVDRMGLADTVFRARKPAVA